MSGEKNIGMAKKNRRKKNFKVCKIAVFFQLRKKSETGGNPEGECGDQIKGKQRKPISFSGGARKKEYRKSSKGEFWLCCKF